MRRSAVRIRSLAPRNRRSEAISDLLLFLPEHSTYVRFSTRSRQKTPRSAHLGTRNGCSVFSGRTSTNLPRISRSAHIAGRFVVKWPMTKGVFCQNTQKVTRSSGSTNAHRLLVILAVDTSLPSKAKMLYPRDLFHDFLFAELF